MAAEDYEKCLELEPNNKTFIEKLKDSRKNLFLNPSDLKNTEKPKMKKVFVREESSEGSDVEFNDSKKSNKNEEKDSKSDGHPQDPQKVHKDENPPVNRFVEEISKNSPITQIPKPNANKIEKMNENGNIFTPTKMSEQDHFTNLLDNSQHMSDYNALNLAERSRRPRPKTGNKDEPKVRKFQSTPDSYGLEDDDIFKDL